MTQNKEDYYGNDERNNAGELIHQEINILSLCLL